MRASSTCWRAATGARKRSRCGVSGWPGCCGPYARCGGAPRRATSCSCGSARRKKPPGARVRLAQVTAAPKLSTIVGSMIAIQHLTKQFGKQLLFVDASFQLNPGEKVGLVGPNGSGKTTLFRIIAGEETPEDGDVSVPRRMTIGYFRQDVEEMSGRSVLDEAIAGSSRLGSLHHELHDLELAMADPARAAD